MPRSPEDHAENWDLRHEDFKDNDFLYDVYSVMRRKCLGSNLARLEFQVGVEQVLSPMSDFALAPGADAPFHGNSVTRGFRSIPVVFSPGTRSAA